MKTLCYTCKHWLNNCDKFAHEKHLEDDKCTGYIFIEEIIDIERRSKLTNGRRLED